MMQRPALRARRGILSPMKRRDWFRLRRNALYQELRHMGLRGIDRGGTSSGLNCMA